MGISTLLPFRKIALPLFAKINPGDITIKHHYTGDSISLHSFRHKGYWFHGKKREQKSMDLFSKMISAGDTVIEIGGHIGYLSLYFASLSQGRVIVFEPGKNNLPYIRRNVAGKGNIVLIEKGAASTTGSLPFYIEALTGQNNSFVQDFERLQVNQKNAFVEAKPEEVIVEVVKLDEFIEEENVTPAFVKIDVEGFEFDVLKGLLESLRKFHPICMIEIQSHHKEILSSMLNLGYLAFNEDLLLLEDHSRIDDNTFFLHPGTHGKVIADLGIVL
jgi:FkbM family methyltransferase